MSIARGVTCAFLLSASALAAEPGKAVGTFTYDSTPVTLAHAVEKKVEGLFDSSKQDTLVVLSDKPLGSTAPDDDIELSLRARKGDIAALMLRIDGAKLVNVSVFHKGLAGGGGATGSGAGAGFGAAMAANSTFAAYLWPSKSFVDIFSVPVPGFDAL